MTTVLLDDAVDRPLVAYAIPRTAGPAVTRNRLRRRLRAITRDLDLRPGTYLISARAGATALSFDELTRHVRDACHR
jgi:ribonuclease P protein component